VNSGDRLLLLFLTATGIAGLGIALYLTVVHYSTLPLACSSSGIVDCERVLSSPYGMIGATSVPTSMAGIVWFVVSIGITAAGFRSNALAWRLLHLIWAGFGLATVLYLVYVEIDRLGAICAWCTVVHLLVLATLLAALYRWQLRPRERSRQ